MNRPSSHRGRAQKALAAASAAACLSLLGAPPATAELVQKGSLRVSVKGGIAPTALPRRGAAPVSVKVGGHISSTDPGGPPQLREIAVAIHRRGRLALRGLPRCRIGHINPSTSREAISACRDSLIGSGRFSANVKLPEQSPFPSQGKVLAFNGRFKGRPAILAHIYGTKPVPTAYVLPFQIARRARGTFGTVMEASLPRVTGDWGYVTGLSLKLGRRFNQNGKASSYLSAGCPAPPGFRSAPFPLLRTSFAFAGGRNLTSTLTRRCRVRG